ncbi:MAG TPA: cbb3-type cytochrome c oxidase subunit II [Verrucomicrobiae bacterium]
MKTGIGVFLAVTVTLGASWAGFVVAPALQLGSAKQTTVLLTGETWPQQRTGAATLGQQVYRANGCVACHTTQIRQTGIACDVVVTKPGKNPAAVNAIVSAATLTGLSKEAADALSDKINQAGGTSEIHIVPVGPDIKAGWGVRHSVAADFLYDNPVQLGTVRVGPDLANVGGRLPSAQWQLAHLYAPGIVKGSTMPSYKFLFTVTKVGATPSPDALTDLPKELAPADGYEVVPTTEAKQLVAYLLSLRADVPLYEAPFTPATSKP